MGITGPYQQLQAEQRCRSGIPAGEGLVGAALEQPAHQQSLHGLWEKGLY